MSSLPAPISSGGPVSDRTFTEPMRLSGGTIAPSHGLYQPSFSLGEPDFLRLKSNSPWLTSAGSAVLSFGVAYGLPLVVRAFLHRHDDPKVPISSEDIFVASAMIAMGGVLLFASLLWSREKRAVLKRIDSHFKENPATLMYEKKQ